MRARCHGARPRAATAWPCCCTCAGTRPWRNCAPTGPRCTSWRTCSIPTSARAGAGWPKDWRAITRTCCARAPDCSMKRRRGNASMPASAAAAPPPATSASMRWAASVAAPCASTGRGPRTGWKPTWHCAHAAATWMRCWRSTHAAACAGPHRSRRRPSSPNWTGFQAGTSSTTCTSATPPRANSRRSMARIDSSGSRPMAGDCGFPRRRMQRDCVAR